MANYGETGTNYQLINETVTKLNESRKQIYDAIEAIKTQVDETKNWQGPDADAVKKMLLDRMTETYSTAKWMNEFTWYLTELSKKMEEAASRRASE